MPNHRQVTYVPEQFVVREDSDVSLADYASVPSRLEVREILEISGTDVDAAEFHATTRTIDRPFMKDYDAPPSIHPREWAEHFDLRNWGFFSGILDDIVVARAAVAWTAADVAHLWDLRIAPENQRHGFGSILFRAVEQWARQRGAKLLEVETQNINAPACAFYARQGCVLQSVNRSAYPDLPSEIQLLWVKRLRPE
jgi:GNAT superfamily N-acetyltransferase